MADNLGLTPLIQAVEYGRTSIVELLLDQPYINIDKESPSGSTALMYAVIKQDAATMRLLLERGARDTMDSRIVEEYQPQNSGMVNPWQIRRNCLRVIRKYRGIFQVLLICLAL
jgi:ankyrin repeat protein